LLKQVGKGLGERDILVVDAGLKIRDLQAAEITAYFMNLELLTSQRCLPTANSESINSSFKMKSAISSMLSALQATSRPG
jgi:hypothetical protein